MISRLEIDWWPSTPIEYYFVVKAHTLILHSGFSLPQSILLISLGICQTFRYVQARAAWPVAGSNTLLVKH